MAEAIAPPRSESPTGAPSGVAPLFTPRQIKIILAGLMSGMFLAALDQTIVSTAIRTIADDLNGLTIQAWATTAYLITSTIATPLYGKLSDIYGRRPLFLFAITIFVFGSVLSGFAQTMYQLAIFRGVQGIGAGGLFALALAIIGDIVPPRERARYQGFFLAVFGTSSVLGPVVGGTLAGQANILGITGWRWVFLINVPVGIFALALVARVLHLPHIRRDHRVDWPGAVALAVGLVPLLIVAEQGRDWGWGSTRAIACYTVGVIFTGVFIAIERAYGDEALLPLRLFQGKTFSIATVLNVIVGAGMFGGLACLPLYLQIVKGKSPTEAGLLLLPLMLGIMSGSIGSGQYISRTGRYRIFPITGMFLLTGALLAMSRITADTSIVVVDIYALVFGLGLGLNMQTLVLAVQNAVPPRDMGVATSSATFFRSMGGTLGTAIFLSILFNSLPDKIGSAFKTAAGTSDFQSALKDPAVLSDPANAPIVGMLKAAAGGAKPQLQASSLNDSSFIAHLDPRLAKPFLVGFASSMDIVFFYAALVLVLGVIVVFFLPEEQLRTQSGLEASHAEVAEEKAAADLEAADLEAETEALLSSERDTASPSGSDGGRPAGH